MYRFLFSVILLLVSILGYADRMMDIMQNYNAKTMSIAAIDSVLAGENEQVKNERFRRRIR